MTFREVWLYVGGIPRVGLRAFGYERGFWGEGCCMRLVVFMERDAILEIL